ncbi:hypothetical protein ACP4OV_000586 [Aristida adscensionis]
MEVAAAAAATMDFHALSRRELQALCKRNGVRANMTNAAMAEALQSLTTVDGIDEIGTTLCLPTPGKSVMKSAAKAVVEEEEQHGSPLPRGRRVSVKSPEAIRMDLEEGEDELKRDLVKEIVRTPGVALRSTSRRARATPAPIPTPAPPSSVRASTRRAAARKTEEVVPTPATLRRSQRTAARKAAEPVEAEQRAEEVSTAKRPTRRCAKTKMMMALDDDDEVAADAPKGEEKVQEEAPKDVASDVKCDDPEEEEVTEILGGNSKEEEPEMDEEADSSNATVGSVVVLDKSCADPKVAEMVEEEATAPQEGTVEAHETIDVEKSAPLATMEESPVQDVVKSAALVTMEDSPIQAVSVEDSTPLPAMDDSPILGVMSKLEAADPVTENAQDASDENGEGVAEWSPVREMTDEIIPVTEEEAVVAVELAIKEDGFTLTGKTDHSPKKILPAADPEDDETSEEDSLSEEEADLTDDETCDDDEASEEDDFSEEMEGAASKIPQAELIDDESSEEDEVDEDEEWTSDDDDASEEIESTDESYEENIEINEEKAEAVQMLQETKTSEEPNEDGSAEEDDFTSDLPPEFDNVEVPSDAETASDNILPVTEEMKSAFASEIDTVLESLDESDITEQHEVSSGEQSGEQFSEETHVAEEEMKEVANMVDTIVKSDAVGAKQLKELTTEELHCMSMRKLKSIYRAAKEGKKRADDERKRLPLTELDDNTVLNC